MMAMELLAGGYFFLANVYLAGGLGVALGAGIAAVVLKAVATKQESLKKEEKQRELENFRNTIDSKTEEIQLLSHDREEKLQKLEETAKEREEYQKKVNQLDQENKAIKTKIAEYEEKLVGANRDSTEKGQTIASLQEELNEKSVTFETVSKSLREKELLLDKVDEDKNELNKQIEESGKKVEQVQQESQKKIETLNEAKEDLEKKVQELENKIPDLENGYKQNARVRARAIAQVKRVLDQLESISLPQEILEEEVSGEMDDDAGLEEMSVRLMEQESVLESQQSKIKELENDYELRNDQDVLILKQAEKMELYQNQLIELGKLRAEQEESLDEKEKKLKEYEEKLGKVQSGEALPDAGGESHPVLAIEKDASLNKAHKKTMIMLYSQYTRGKSKNEKAADESSSENSAPEATIPDETSISDETSVMKGDSSEPNETN